MLGGVCAGIAEYFSLDPSVVRIIAILAAAAGGTGVVAYIIGWLVIPSAPATGEAQPETSEETLSQGVAEIQETAKKAADELKHTLSDGNGNHRFLVGIVLIGIGVLYLFKQFIPWLTFAKLWPFIFVLVGIWIIVSPNRTK